jgi:hypothetical protein
LFGALFLFDAFIFTKEHNKHKNIHNPREPMISLVIDAAIRIIEPPGKFLLNLKRRVW